MAGFSTTTYGKWILAGEHAVLRGSPALAFPLLSRTLTLSFESDPEGFDIQFQGEHGADLKLLISGVIENAHRFAGQSKALTGQFTLSNSLPVGTGLGASAALCGAVARWCAHEKWIQSEDIYEFSRRLEDLFHGESSGVDLAVSLSGQGVRFVRGGGQTAVRPTWQPRLYLSYCGRRGMTSECVAKVKELLDSNPKLGASLDQRMQSAVTIAEKALLSTETVGLPQLKESLELASSCFEEWGLCTDEVATHLRLLKEAGAIAAKPTGSGGGGYCLSLWRDEPPVSLAPLLVPAFSRTR